LQGHKALQGNSLNDPPLLLVYDFTVPGREPHGLLTVEVTDFAGELLNPAKPPEENAEILRRTLATVDALLVLAEVPHNGQATDRLSIELHSLQQAFLELAHTRGSGLAEPTPIGLLLNKWDRRGPAAELAAHQDEEIQSFLKGSPAHQQLFDALSAVASLLKTFPVSAFGESETERDERGLPQPGSDRPRRFPLPSFGLEDPFVWGCLESDKLKLASIAEKRERKWWLLNPLECWATWRKATSLLRRTPPGASGFAVLKAVRGRSLAGWFCFLCITLPVFGAFTFTCFALWEWKFVDAPAYQQANTIRLSPKSPEEMAWAERWYEEYAASGGLSHCGLRWSGELSTEDAGRIVSKWRRERDDSRRRAAEEATEPETKLKLIEAYLADFPSGMWRDGAERQRDELRRSVDERKEIAGLVPIRDANMAKLRKLRQQFYEARAGRDDKEQVAALKGYYELPTTKREWHPPDYSAYLEFGDSMSKEVSDQKLASDNVRQYQGWKKSEKDLRRQIEDCDLGTAAATLKACEKEYLRYPECLKEIISLKSNFALRSDEAVKAVVNRAIETRTWRPQVEKLETVSKHNDFLELAAKEGSEALRKQIDRLKLAWDRRLYEDYVTEPTVERAEGYLNNAPLKRMKASAERLVSWNDVIHHEKALRLEITQIEWKKWYDDSAVRIKLEWKRPGQENWDELYNETTQSTKNGTGGPFQGKEFKVIPKDAFELRVSLRAEGTTYVFSPRLEGSLAENVSSVSLISGMTKTINADRETVVTVRITGLEPKPQPDPWKE